jgi:hypothetical protein
MQMPASAPPAAGDCAGTGGSGCCAVTLLLYRGTGIVAWLGDARCVLARKEKSKDDDTAAKADGVSTAKQSDESKGSEKLNAFAISKDHKAVVLKEKQRIEKVCLAKKLLLLLPSYQTCSECTRCRLVVLLLMVAFVALWKCLVLSAMLLSSPKE